VINVVCYTVRPLVYCCCSECAPDENKSGAIKYKFV
jgi:hypothetical protein